LTATLTQIAYLTSRVSTYLGLRLPAEITLPHRGYPLATIFAPASSYLSREVPFPGTGSSQHSSNSPRTSRILDTRPLPHPRTLFIHTSLAQLAKDDSAAYSIFLEGVTLLAWDIAWLCKVQGMSGFDDEQDICPVGLNLWNLLLAEPETLSARGGSVSGEGSRIVPQNSQAPPASNGPTLFGQLSHGTTLSFFGAAQGKDVVGTWKLQNPARAFDKIKRYLQSEMQKAEWEDLGDTEWDGFQEDEAVMVRGQQQANEGKVVLGSNRPTQAVEPNATTTARRESHGAGSESSKTTVTSAKTQGANGWTKVRNRNSDAPQPT
jgi:hypothetical protein